MDRPPELLAHQTGANRLAAPLCERSPARRLSGSDRGAERGQLSSPLAIRTARLLLLPVSHADITDMVAIKSDPRVFAVMLGGVRSPVRAAEELAAEMAFWSARGCGIWTVRDARAGDFLGLTGFTDRPDGRGIALRFAFWPEARGRGLAREAAFAALRFGHEQAGLRRIVAVARESNIGSRTVLGGLGMRQAETFDQGGHRMILYESLRATGRT